MLQTISTPECFLTVIAGKNNSFKMVCTNLKVFAITLENIFVELKCFICNVISWKCHWKRNPSNWECMGMQIGGCAICGWARCVYIPAPWPLPHICPNCKLYLFKLKMYLSLLENLFVQIAKYICMVCRVRCISDIDFNNKPAPWPLPHIWL